MNCTQCGCSLEGRSVYSLDNGEPGKFCMDCAPLNASPKEICFKPVPITNPTDKSVREVLQTMLDRADDFSMVMVVAMDKTGEEHCRSSKSSYKEKATLFAFFQAYIMSLYNIVKSDKYD